MEFFLPLHFEDKAKNFRISVINSYIGLLKYFLKDIKFRLCILVCSIVYAAYKLLKHKKKLNEIMNHK